MSEEFISTDNGGIDFCDLLTILFIALKLLGHITWSWVWVLSPIWIPITLALAGLSVVGIFLLIKGDK